MSDPET
jgi:hypothetical protein